jgi:hypothetical protein
MEKRFPGGGLLVNHQFGAFLISEAQVATWKIIRNSEAFCRIADSVEDFRQRETDRGWGQGF